VKPRNNELNRLLDACNKTARASQQPTLYLDEDTEEKTKPKNKGKRLKQLEPELEPAMTLEIPDCSDSFHISLAWSLKKPSNITINQAVTTDELKPLTVLFDSVKVKIGNTLTSVPLLSKAAKTRSSILG
jgi:hypothetical protein